MNVLDLLEESQALAKRLGMEVRQEWLGEQTGGACRIGQRWILYVDLSLPIAEQLEQTLWGIYDSGLPTSGQPMSPLLERVLQRIVSMAADASTTA